MKRYNPHTIPAVTPDNYTEMREDPEGEWVRYRDVALYEALLAEYGLSYFAELADAIKREREACTRRLSWLIDELWSDLHEVDREQLIKEAMKK